MGCLDLIFKGEEGDALREKEELYGELAINADEKDGLKEEFDNIANWVSTLPILDDYDVAMSLAKEFNMNITQAKQSLEAFPREYLIGEKAIPDIVKQLKKYRRKLKGEEKIEFTKSIDNLVMEYGNHLSSCIKSIYWLSPYETPLRQMRYKESDLRKLHLVKDETTRRDIVKSVCDNQGIGSRQIHERLPLKLHRRSSPQIIAKVADRLNITNVDGEYYKLPMEIKKDLYAYTAAFIDSDGYITMDRNFNPRVGMVATGNRGKAFVSELHRS